MLTPKDVLTFGGCYLCATFGENRSRNTTVRVRTDRQTDRRTHAVTETKFIICPVPYAIDMWQIRAICPKYKESLRNSVGTQSFKCLAVLPTISPDADRFSELFNSRPKSVIKLSLKICSHLKLMATRHCEIFGIILTDSAAAPKIWDSLRPALPLCTSPDTFRCHHKTHYLQQAFQSA